MSERTLRELAENVALRWQELGVQLDIPYLDIQRIRMQHPNDLVSRVMAILDEWQSRQGNLATGKRLKEVVIDLKYVGLANRLFPND